MSEIAHQQNPHHDSNWSKNIPNPKTINALMVKEMNEMSAQEREIIYDEIHGIPRVVDEEPDFVDRCLNSMQLALNKIRYKPAYDIALSQNPHYVGGKKFCLMFLRSTCFDAKEAATKIVKYFELKKEYFGTVSLGFPIRNSNLGDCELECLKRGAVQTMPFRDKGGRLVIFIMFQFFKFDKEPIDYVRGIFYSTMTLLEDEETQKRGFVAVVTGIEKLDLSPKIRQFIWYMSIHQTAMPFRMVANHFCIESDGVALQLVSLANNTWGKVNRARNRIHKGTQTEWMYKLMAFGIPVEYAPITNGGQVKMKFFREWLALRSLLEANHYPLAYRFDILQSTKYNLDSNQTSNDNDVIIFPRWTDVFSGKGSLAQQYSGNLLFNQLVEGYQLQYQRESSRKKKWEVTKLVWKLLQEENIRFLDRHENGYCWKEVRDENEIYNRIMYRLRLKRQPKSPQPPAEGRNNNKQLDDTEGSVSFLNQSGELNCSFDCCNSSGMKKRRKV